jgi:hypothetical protein
VSYLRWDSSSNWYVFWENGPARAKEEQRLAIWHCEVRDQAFSCTYAEIRAMLRTGDFSTIPGFAEHYRQQVQEVLVGFVDDVDRDFGDAGGKSVG